MTALTAKKGGFDFAHAIKLTVLFPGRLQLRDLHHRFRLMDFLSVTKATKETALTGGSQNTSGEKTKNGLDWRKVKRPAVQLTFYLLTH
jgi:hypothetical protein